MSPQHSKTLEVVKALSYFSNCELAFLYNLCNSLGWAMHFQCVHLWFVFCDMYLVSFKCHWLQK